MLVFVCFIRIRRPWRPSGRYGAGTRPMAASSGFERSPGCAPSGDAPRIKPLHHHGHRNRRRFACIFCRVNFVVGHNHKLKTMLWSIYEINMSYQYVHSYVINLFVLYGRSPSMMNAVLDTICNGGRAFHRKKMSSSRIKLIWWLFYCFIPNPAYAPSANPFGRG